MADQILAFTCLLRFEKIVQKWTAIHHIWRVKSADWSKGESKIYPWTVANSFCSDILSLEVTRMKNPKFLVGMVLGAALTAGGMLVAQGPRHPNLEAAQQLVDQAIARVAAAQQANDFDMNGHAQHAKDLLARASNEIRQAAHAANR
jgi:hypothetical protein